VLFYFTLLLCDAYKFVKVIADYRIFYRKVVTKNRQKTNNIKA